MDSRSSSIQVAPLTLEVVAGWNALPDEDLLHELLNYNHEFARRFQFSDIDAGARKELCEFFGERPQSSGSAVRAALLEMIRLLARDKNGIDTLLSEAVVLFVLASSGLMEGDTTVDNKLIEEAEKCLINVLHHSERARILFEKHAASGLVKRLSAFVSDDFSDESVSFVRPLSVTDRVDLWFFDLRIAFVTSAHMRSLQDKWRQVEVVKVFTDTVNQAFALSAESSFDEPDLSPPSPTVNRAGEAMKTLYNVLCRGVDVLSEETMSVVCRQACAVIRRVEWGPEMLQHGVNLLTLIPIRKWSIDIICPKILPDFKGAKHEDRDMVVPDILVTSVSEQLDLKKSTSDRELLITYFTVLLNLCCECKEARGFCRKMVLPPLTAAEVERRPDDGETLRNRMVRAIHQSVSRDLVAEFLFVLCKRSVPRMIKYTGFGHAAGLLADRGLLGSVNQRKADDSEDSETDDYKHVESSVNPVSGYIPRDTTNPLEGMSDEQKEFEAMKLVNAIDQMMKTGAIRPAIIGEDGRPRELSHVKELMKDHATADDEPNSDDE